jgi:phage tail sheath protein FI
MIEHDDDGIPEAIRRLVDSLEKGLGWVASEANDEALWEAVREELGDTLYAEWRLGTMVGDRPDQAFFVRCDRTTMTQEDLDNGRLVVIIGVAPLRPAEFLILRIGQWTRDRRDP